MFVLYSVTSFFFCLYVIIIHRFRYHWNRQPEYKAQLQTVTDLKISVVVAFRNELKNLPILIKSLENQDLSPEKFEVILCDDSSDDGSGEFVKTYCRNIQRFRYCSPVKNEHGKKKAVHRGISISSNEIIVLTDADCITGERWLSAILSYFENYSPDMVIGLVDMNSGRDFAGVLQEMEFLSLTGSGAAAAIMQKPLFCSGANLAYKKSSFNSFKDPLSEKIVSGDDTFFMHKLKNESAGKIMLLKSRESAVTTRRAGSLREFLDQRSRWASKSIYYRDRNTVLTALIVYFLNAAILLSLLMVFAGNGFFWLFPTVFMLKAVTDYLFLRDIMSFFGKKTPAIYFIAGELIYPFYIVFTPLRALITGYRWKGRDY